MDMPFNRRTDIRCSFGNGYSKLKTEAVSFTGAQVGIITDSSHTRARIIKINADKIKEAIKRGRL